MLILHTAFLLGGAALARIQSWHEPDNWLFQKVLVKRDWHKAVNPGWFSKTFVHSWHRGSACLLLRSAKLLFKKIVPIQVLVMKTNQNCLPHGCDEIETKVLHSPDLYNLITSQCIKLLWQIQQTCMYVQYKIPSVPQDSCLWKKWKYCSPVYLRIGAYCFCYEFM